MVIDDLPLITDTIRTQLNSISEQRLSSIELSVNRLLTYTKGDYVTEFDYHNIYQIGKNNIVYGYGGAPVMSVFDFDKRSKIKIMKVLGLSDNDININVIRVCPNTIVPFHLDLNKGDVGRENPILSIVISGGLDSMLYISNKLDGSYQFALRGNGEFIMYPTQVVHGAKSGNVPYSLLQIQLEK